MRQRSRIRTSADLWFWRSRLWFAGIFDDLFGRGRLAVHTLTGVRLALTHDSQVTESLTEMGITQIRMAQSRSSGKPQSGSAPLILIWMSWC